MPGAVLELIAESKSDKLLIGQPTKTFFKKTFSSYTNFGKQKFRIDFEGNKRLNYNSPTIFEFKIPRYGDLLQELFFSFTLPNIWSPLLSFGGIPVQFCSACRTQISSKLNTDVPGIGDVYSTFVNDISQNCELCGCECTTKYSYTNLIYPSTYRVENTPTPQGMKWLNRVFPFEFKWIENIGVQAIRTVRLYSNNTILQEFTGQYLLNMVYRDFSDSQKKLFDKMIGNTKDLMDPANYSNRNGHYPNAAYFGSMYEKMPYGLEPSIREKKLYIPINLWSTLNNKTPLPLVSMQYSELRLEVEMRPVNEWWVVKNVVNELSIQLSDPKYSVFSESNAVSTIPLPPNPGVPDPDISGCSPYEATLPQDGISAAGLVTLLTFVPQLYISPAKSNYSIYDLKYFLKEPPPKIITNPEEDLSGSLLPEIGALPYPLYPNKIVERYYEEIPKEWFADVHLIGNYTFLTDEERYQFSKNCQEYLIREVHEQDIYNLIGGNNTTNIQTQGLVISWMWYFQRSDVGLRNQWSNYTNLRDKDNLESISLNINGFTNPNCYPKMPIDGKINNIVWQNVFTTEDVKTILQDWSLYFDSSVREYTLDNGIISWVDRYSRSNGSGIDGVYYYNFCLDTSPFFYQPTGAINISKFNTVTWNYNLLYPVGKDTTSNIEEIFYNFNLEEFKVNASVTCVNNASDPDSLNNPVTINTKPQELYLWNFNLHIMEERYNILKINNGIASLVFARTI